MSVPTSTEHGVLGVRDADWSLHRIPPSPDLACLVERYWLVAWDLPPGRSVDVTLLPHPCVNLALDGGTLGVSGVGLARFTYPLHASGRVFGVKFRPGAFQPLLGAAISDITDRVVPAEQLWGPAAATLSGRLESAGGVEELVSLVEEFLLARMPPYDPQVELVGRIVATLLYDRDIGRVDEVAARFGIPMRTLQRLFARYVGVSPKWVLRRYRLHEAAAALAADEHRPWADVAAELGYFDQSHFIRDFTAAVGMPPLAYAEACRRRVAPVGT